MLIKKKKLPVTKSTVMFVGCHSKSNHMQKARNDSKLESGLSAKAACGSGYKTVASLM